MPVTPFHFGPHACVSLPLHRYLDIPVFLGANLAVDIEPLLVMTLNLDYPVHGYCHTLLFGILVGLMLATSAFPLRRHPAKLMARFRLPYTPSYFKMVLSGILGVWLHVLCDAPLYADIRPFYPSQANPLYEVLPAGVVYGICAACFVPAVLLYIQVASREKRTRVSEN